MLYRRGQYTYPFFPEILFKFLQSHWLHTHVTTVEKTVSCERGKNRVAMTIISPRKEYWPSRGSNQQSPVLKAFTLPTEHGAQQNEI